MIYGACIHSPLRSSWAAWSPSYIHRIHIRFSRSAASSRWAYWKYVFSAASFAFRSTGYCAYGVLQVRPSPASPVDHVSAQPPAVDSPYLLQNWGFALLAQSRFTPSPAVAASIVSSRSHSTLRPGLLPSIQSSALALADFLFSLSSGTRSIALPSRILVGSISRHFFGDFLRCFESARIEKWTRARWRVTRGENSTPFMKFKGAFGTTELLIEFGLGLQCYINVGKKSPELHIFSVIF